MKKFLRRSGAALLADCTVWVVAATVESRSLPAAAEAMRESFQLPKVLVQLELEAMFLAAFTLRRELG